MPRIRKPDELPMSYLHVYWANWYAKLRGRPAVHPEAYMACIGCRTEGLIGFELKHRGVPSKGPVSTRINLMCDRCWSDHRADTETPTSPKSVGKTGRMQRTGSRAVERAGRRSKGRA